MKSKKAVSAVVASLLLVVITIIAVIMVWQFIKIQIIDKNIKESACYEYRDYVRVVGSDYTCYNITDTRLQIERSSDDKAIEGISVTISSEDSSKAYTLKNGTSTTGVKMNSGSYQDTIILPNLGESKTYLFSGIIGTSASITVITNGKSCDVIRQNYDIEKCG